MNDTNDTLKLSKNILARKEKKYVFLFEPVTCSVTRMNYNFYTDLINNNIKISSNREIYEILKKQNIIYSEEIIKREELPLNSAYGINNLYSLKGVKAPFLIIWAITPKCNLDCIYCFPQVNNKKNNFLELSMKQIDIILKKIIKAQIFHVTITGGEPLLYRGIWDIFTKLENSNMKVGIVTNGTILNEDIIEKFSTKYKYVDISVSLDSINSEVNAITRGEGTLEKTLLFVKTFIKFCKFLSISITLNRYNYETLEETIDILKKMKITHFNIADLKPFEKKNYDKIKLTKTQQLEIKDKILKLIDLNKDIYINPTELLIFSMLEENKEQKIMKCPAGGSVGYIDFKGNFYPCTQLPTFCLGNLLEKNSILSLWRTSENRKNLLKLKNMNISEIKQCNECERKLFCDGGCRGEALWFSGNILGLSPNCPNIGEYYDKK